MPVSEFQVEDRLYRGFRKSEIGPDGKLDTNAIKFPDFSCNWSRLSEPEDVRFREGGSPADGCYSFTVSVARYQDMANPVHDPLCGTMLENYAHVEVRALREGEGFDIEPPKGRKIGSAMKKLAYRENIKNKMVLHLEAEG